VDLHRLMEHTPARGSTRRHRIVRELVHPSADDSALEIGCAQGYMVNLYLRQRVRRVVGLDIDPEDLARARAYAVAHPDSGAVPDFLIGSAESLPLPDNCFSLVYCMDVLEHVDIPPRARQRRSEFWLPADGW
jgi:ubiquinone/menaquinone biosynthesis C-methylase UbiE